MDNVLSLNLVKSDTNENHFLYVAFTSNGKGSNIGRYEIVFTSFDDAINIAKNKIKELYKDKILNLEFSSIRITLHDNNCY